MKKNKEEFNDSSRKFPKLLYQSICCEKSEIPIYNSRIYIKYTKKVKNHIPKYSSKELLYNIFNSPLYCLHNKVAANFIKLIGIYQLIILHFHVTMVQAEDPETQCKKLSAKFPWEMAEPLCSMCKNFRIFDSYCNKPECCCKKSCCKKKKSEEGDFDYSPYMMGADGQMYNPMYQGQMMSPQMYQMGMMHPQMFPGQMMYPQMYQGGMQMPGMQMPGMHNEEMQNQ